MTPREINLCISGYTTSRRSHTGGQRVAVREAVERLIGDAWDVGISAGDME